jgi:hypothetical protein
MNRRRYTPGQAEVRLRYYFHGDVAQNRTWYNRREDTFRPIGLPVLVRPSDVRLLQRQLKRARHWRTYFRPEKAPNIFESHPWAKLPARTLRSLWIKGDRGDWFVIPRRLRTAVSEGHVLISRLERDSITKPLRPPDATRRSSG